MEYWIWLSSLPGIGPILQKRLLRFFETPEKIYALSISELCKVPGIGEILAEKIARFRMKDVRNTIKDVQTLGIKIVTSEHPTYKDVFSCLHTPILFYYLGKLPEKRGIAVVGARRCTEEGKQVAEEIGSLLAHQHIPVISGLAKGIDSYAHTSCIKAGGYTMAVLANGVDICYPKEHKSLYEKILADDGAIISAFPPTTTPQPPFFIQRNSHIVAWSTDVIIVQASEKSGSLTTATFAFSENRNVYAVPHSIFLQQGKGSNQLLANGAKIYLGPESIGLTLSTKKSHPLHPLEKKILDFLNEKGATEILEMCNELQLTEIALQSTIMDLEMKNKLKTRATKVFPIR